MFFFVNQIVIGGRLQLKVIAISKRNSQMTIIGFILFRGFAGGIKQVDIKAMTQKEFPFESASEGEPFININAVNLQF